MMQKYKDRKDLKQILLRMKLRIDCSSSEELDDSTPTFSIANNEHLSPLSPVVNPHKILVPV